MTNQTHTKTPWKVDESNNILAYRDGALRTVLFFTDTDKITETRRENKANAAFIVRAVNSHDALLAALEAVLKTCEDGVIHRHETGKPMWSAFDHMKTITRAAIAKAKGG